MPFDEPLYSHLGSLSNFTPDIHFNPLPDFGDLPTHFRETLLVNKSASFPSYKISLPIVRSTSSDLLFYFKMY